MDTRPEYIKQCGKAEEIQALMPNSKMADHFEEGCVYHNPVGGTFYLEYPNFPEGCVWLPFQDQLQKMVIGNKGLQTVCYMMYQWAISSEGCKYTMQGGSMEQLWLGFVMWILYAKVWTGEEWQRKDTLGVGEMIKYGHSVMDEV